MKRSINGNILTFTFDKAADGTELAPVTFDATKAAAANRAYAEMHGWQARIGDNAAISRKQKDGSVIVVTEAMRRDAVEEMVAHYESGADGWDMRGGARVVPPNPAFVKIAEMRGCTYAEAQAWYNEKLIAEMQAMIDGGDTK